MLVLFRIRIIIYTYFLLYLLCMLETRGLQEMESPASFLENKCESTSALVCYSETGSGDA
jgi:hypothetical protein